MSLTSKIAGLAIILVVATTVIFGLLVQRAAKQAITGREGDRLIFGVSEVAKKLHEDIENAVNHVEVSAATSAVQGLVRSTENGGIDPTDGITTAEWHQRLANNFKALLSKEKSYLSMAIIGAADDGREIVKVVRDKEGQIRIDSANLRQHGNQNFFQNAMRQPPGTPYISEIMPQDGGGPLVIDVAAPISNLHGQKFGILMLSVDCSRLIARLASFNDAVSKLYMTTLDGRYIINPDAARPLATAWGKRGRIQDDMPWLAPAFDNSATASKAKLAAQGTDRTSVAAPLSTAPNPSVAVYPEGKSYKDKGYVARTLCVSAGSGDFKRTWVILGVIDANSLVNSALRFRRYLGAIVVGLIALSVLAAWLLARRITRPISRLTEAAQRMAEGRHDAAISVDKSDDKTVGELANAFIMMQNVVKHRERRLNEARAQIEAIVNSATSAIISVNEHGTIIRTNLATQTLFGYEAADLEGKKLSDLVRDRYVDSLFDGEGETIGKPLEITAQRADGTTFPAEISVSKVRSSRNGRPYVVMLTDLSERKRYESLDNQLKLERIKGEFVSTVSHELRTPLTAINGALALLRSDRIGTMPTNAKPLLSIAHSNSERLMRLINDILDMERIKSGTLNFEFKPLDVAILLYEAARANAGYAALLHVNIEVSPTPQGMLIMGDPDRIAQALSNLISNAAKFSPRDGTVAISAERKDGWVRISVSDKGEGIPESFRDRVFSRFAQADSTDARQKGGSGLGLSITKAIAEAHSGKVGFRTAVGKGTTFFIDLPEASECRTSEGLDETAERHPPEPNYGR